MRVVDVLIHAVIRRFVPQILMRTPTLIAIHWIVICMVAVDMVLNLQDGV